MLHFFSRQRPVLAGLQALLSTTWRKKGGRWTNTAPSALYKPSPTHRPLVPVFFLLRDQEVLLLPVLVPSKYHQLHSIHRDQRTSLLFYCDNCAGCVRSGCGSCQPSHQTRGGPSAEAPGHSTAGFKCQNALKACSFSTQGPALCDPAISASPPLQRHNNLRSSTPYHGKCRREPGPPLRPSPRCPPEQSRHEECKMSSLLSSLVTARPPEQGLTSTVPRSPPRTQPTHRLPESSLLSLGSQEPAAAFGDVSRLVSLQPHISAEQKAGGNSFQVSEDLLHPKSWGSLKRRGAALGGRVLPQQRSQKGITFLKSSCLTFLNRTFLSYTYFLMLPFQT